MTQIYSIDERKNQSTYLKGQLDSSSSSFLSYNSCSSRPTALLAMGGHPSLKLSIALYILTCSAKTTSQKWTKLEVQGTLFQSLTLSWPVHQFTQLTVLHTAKTTSQKWFKLEVQGTLFQSLTPSWPVHQFTQHTARV